MKKNYVVRELTPSRIREVYTRNLIEDFPPNERKPLDIIELALGREKYVCYGYFNGEHMRAYAFFSIDEKKVLVEFFAVEKSLRNQGLGSRFLQELINGPFKELDCVLLEADDPDFAPDQNELEIRHKRLRFYMSNGLKDTGVRAVANHVEYRILALPVGHVPAGQDALNIYISLYRAMPPEGTYAERMQIEGRVVE